MSIQFVAGWNEFHPNSYGSDENFATCITRGLGKAWGFFRGYDFLFQAVSNSGTFPIVIEKCIPNPQQGRQAPAVIITGRYSGRTYTFFAEAQEFDRVLIIDVKG